MSGHRRIASRAGIAGWGWTLIAAAVALVALPDPAQGCSISSHCYAIADWTVSSPSGFHGGSTQLRTNCMSLGNPGEAFIDNEMWVSKGNYWVETGLTEGTPVGANYRFFWADNRPSGGGYHEHFSTTAWAPNAYYEARVHLTEGNGWNVSVGPLSGTSTGNFAPPAESLEAGAEIATGSSPHTYGSTSSLRWYDQSGVAHNGWSYATHAVLYEDSPAIASWASAYDWARNRIGAVC